MLLPTLLLLHLNKMEYPIINPPNPYIGTLRIFPGTLVKVSGQAKPNATRFAINLQTGPSLNPRDDLALHLSPCFTPPRVVRNSLRNGAWELEEAWGNGAVINPHAPFEIMILAEPEQFKIAVNGGHFCEFKHRIPYQQITHLSIDGDVDIHRITITSTAYSPPTYQPSAPQPPYPTANTGMPMPASYPLLPGATQPTGPYPAAGAYSAPTGPPGPIPTGGTYMSGFPQGTPNPYPQAPMPNQAGPYPHGGPAPTGAGYQSGYPVSKTKWYQLVNGS